MSKELKQWRSKAKASLQTSSNHLDDMCNHVNTMLTKILFELTKVKEDVRTKKYSVKNARSSLISHTRFVHPNVTTKDKDVSYSDFIALQNSYKHSYVRMKQLIAEKAAYEIALNQCKDGETNFESIVSEMGDIYDEKLNGIDKEVNQLPELKPLKMTGKSKRKGSVIKSSKTVLPSFGGPDALTNHDGSGKRKKGRNKRKKKASAISTKGEHNNESVVTAATKHDVEVQLRQCGRSMDKCSNNLVRCNENSDRCVKDSTEYQRRIHVLEADLKAMNERLQSKEALLEDFQIKGRISPNDTQVLTENMNRLRKENRQLLKTLEDYEELQASHAVLKQQNIDKTSELARIGDLMSRMEEDLSLKSRQVEDSNAKVQEYHSKMIENGDRIQSLIGEMRLLKEHRDELQTEADGCLYPGQKGKMLNELERLNRDQSDLQKKYDELNNIHGKMVIHYDTIKNENEELVSKYKVSEEDRRQLASLTSKSALIHETLADARIVIKKKNNDIDVLNDRIECMRNEIRAMEDHESVLKTKLKTAPSEEEMKKIESQLVKCRETYEASVVRMDIFRASSEKWKEMTELQGEKLKKLLKVAKENQHAQDTLEAELKLKRALEEKLEDCNAHSRDLRLESDTRGERLNDLEKELRDKEKTVENEVKVRAAISSRSQKLKESLEECDLRYRESLQQFEEDVKQSNMDNEDLRRKLEEEKVRVEEARMQYEDAQIELKDLGVKCKEKLSDNIEKCKVAMTKKLEECKREGAASIKKLSNSKEVEQLRALVRKYRSEIQRTAADQMEMRKQYTKSTEKVLNEGGEDMVDRVQDIQKRWQKNELERQQDIMQLATERKRLEDEYKKVQSVQNDMLSKNKSLLRKKTMDIFNGDFDMNAFVGLGRDFENLGKFQQNWYGGLYDENTTNLENVLQQFHEMDELSDNLYKVATMIRGKVDSGVAQLKGVLSDFGDRSAYASSSTSRGRDSLYNIDRSVNQSYDRLQREVEYNRRLLEQISDTIKNPQNLERNRENVRQLDNSNSRTYSGVFVTGTKPNTPFGKNVSVNENIVNPFTRQPLGSTTRTFNVDNSGPDSRHAFNRSLSSYRDRADVIMVSYGFKTKSISREPTIFSMFKRSIQLLNDGGHFKRAVDIQMCQVGKKNGKTHVKDLLNFNGKFVPCTSYHKCNFNSVQINGDQCNGLIENMKNSIHEGSNNNDDGVSSTEFIMTIINNEKCFHVVEVLYEHTDDVNLISGEWFNLLHDDIDKPNTNVELIFNYLEDTSDSDQETMNRKLVQVMQYVQNIIQKKQGTYTRFE